MAFTAVAVGAALSAGALFTSLFLPFFLLIGFGALFWGGVTFSAFATLGAALIIKPLMSLVGGRGGGLWIGAVIGAVIEAVGWGCGVGNKIWVVDCKHLRCPKGLPLVSLTACVRRNAFGN